MEVENHVVSLETAKRMKELGWPQGYNNMYVWDKGELRVVQENYDVYHLDSGCIAAPILSELLDVLPPSCTIRTRTSKYEIEYISKQNEWLVCGTNAVTVAGVLWCTLVEEGIIRPKKK